MADDEVAREDHGRLFVYSEGFEDPDLPTGVFSPSQFDMYQKCGRQYEYRYVLGKIKAPGISLVRGKSIHKGAEVTHRNTIEKGRPLTMEEASQSVSDEFEKEKELVEDWEGKTSGDYKDHVLRQFAIYYNTAVPLIKPVAVEDTFAVKFGTVPVRGIIDLIDSVYDVPGGFEGELPPAVEVVSDLKVVGMRWPEQKVRYAPQLTFYSAVKGIPRVRVDLLLDQKSGTKYDAIRSVRTPSDIKLLTEDLEQVVDLIKKGIFPRTNPTTWACTPKFCGYYEDCRGQK